jgi:hypothetical protein
MLASGQEEESPAYAMMERLATVGDSSAVDRYTTVKTSTLLAPCAPSEVRNQARSRYACDQRRAKVRVLITFRSKLELLWTLLPISF